MYHILHIISSNDMKTKLHLFNTLSRTEDSLVAVINYQINSLIEPFQDSL